MELCLLWQPTISGPCFRLHLPHHPLPSVDYTAPIQKDVLPAWVLASLFMEGAIYKVTLANLEFIAVLCWWHGRSQPVLLSLP